MSERLYGIPGSESLHDDIGAAYEQQIEPRLDEGDHEPRVIEEWSVCPPTLHLRSPSDLADWLVEDAAENAGVDGYYDHTEHMARNPEVLAAAEALITAMADRITYRVADKRLAEHAITWDDDDEPLLNGERLYHRRPDASADSRTSGGTP